jgi:hypothetical protein
VPGKPQFSVYDLKCLTVDDLDELHLALQERLRIIRSIRSPTREESEELERRRGRTEALMTRLIRVRRDTVNIKRGDEARAAYRIEINRLKVQATVEVVHEEEDDSVYEADSDA